MATLKEAVDDFLAQKRIAVAGVSRHGGEAANVIYRKLRGAGYEVFATNPKATEVEGDACYPDLRSIPGGVDGVVISTTPAIAATNMPRPTLIVDFRTARFSASAMVASRSFTFFFPSDLDRGAEGLKCGKPFPPFV